MSDQHAGGVAAAKPATLSGTPWEHEADRRNARARHKSHYREQMMAWGLVMVLAAGLYPLLDALHGLPLKSCSVLSGHLGICMVYYAELLLPLAVIAFMLGWLGIRFYYDKIHAWDLAVSNAQHTVDPKKVTKGFTDLFNLYMRTKRRSYLLAGWGMLGLFYVALGALVNFRDAPDLFYWASLVLVAIGSWLLVHYGYKLTSTYLPGEVIVLHTLILCILAISAVTNVEEARQQAAKDAEQFIHDNPWWFYPG